MHTLDSFQLQQGATTSFWNSIPYYVAIAYLAPVLMRKTTLREAKAVFSGPRLGNVIQLGEGRAGI